MCVFSTHRNKIAVLIAIPQRDFTILVLLVPSNIVIIAIFDPSFSLKFQSDKSNWMFATRGFQLKQITKMRKQTLVLNMDVAIGDARHVIIGKLCNNRIEKYIILNVRTLLQRYYVCNRSLENGKKNRAWRLFLSIDILFSFPFLKC